MQVKAKLYQLAKSKEILSDWREANRKVENSENWQTAARNSIILCDRLGKKRYEVGIKK
jgi:hypothetical protein